MSPSELITTLATLIATVVLTVLCIRAIHPLLIRYALARPNARSSHKVPTPQGAGIAVIATTLVVGGIVIAWGTGVSLTLAVLFGATIVIAIVGAVDDLRPLPVVPRFAMQALCILAILIALPAELQIVPAVPLWFERTILLLAALWFVNLTNFMDGLDWITVAEVVPITAALTVIGMAGSLPLQTTLLAAALCGAMIGFAPFNKPVAKMFLGDVGSLPIGLLLAWCFLQLAYAGYLAAAILLPLYYLADATVTLFRRLVRREAFWLAHRSHFYQRATDNGFTVMSVVTNVFLVNIGLAILAGLSVAFNSAPVDLILLVAGGALVALVLRRFATPQLR